MSFSRRIVSEAVGTALLLAAVVEFKLGIDAEGKSLESIADPLSQ